VTDGRASLTYEALWQKTEEWAEALTAILPTSVPVGLCLDNSLAWVLFELSMIKNQLSMSGCLACTHSGFWRLFVNRR